MEGTPAALADTVAPSPGWPAVSVVMPVLNEQRHLRSAVEHILGQDYPGDLELIMALGPSKDGSDEIAAALAAGDSRVRTVENPSGATPSALNAAISASSNPIIVRVDGHAVLPPDYVRTAVQVLRETGADNVGGVMAAEGSTPFETAVARAMTSRLGVGNARYHTGGDAGPADSVYLGVFRRAALQRVGGYDETFARAQDWEMNYRIRSTGGQVWFCPSMRVSYRPRGSVKALAKQYYNYGRWRRAVMRAHPESVTLRYLAAPAAVVAVSTGLVAALWTPVGLLVPGGYVAGVVVGSVVTGRDLPATALCRLPLVYATMHGAWGVGFLTSGRQLGRRRSEPG